MTAVSMPSAEPVSIPRKLTLPARFLGNLLFALVTVVFLGTAATGTDARSVRK